MELGVAAGNAIQMRKPLIPIATVFPVAEEVWSNLLSDSEVADLRLPYRWQLLLADDGSVNASSMPNGQVIVDRGLANLLGSSQGLWAAILSHEIAHIARRHSLRKYLFERQVLKELQSYENAPPVIGDAQFQMAVLGAQIDAPASISKFTRDLEYEADCDGMMLMARTGYHPDFAFAVRHLLRASTEDRSDSEEISLTHPLWSSRDQRSHKTYAVALAEFLRRWSAATSSPGGTPPTIGFLSDSEAKAHPGNQVTATFSLHCANPQEQLKLALRLFRRNPKSKMAQELIEFVRPLSCSERGTEDTFTVKVPSEVYLARNRALEVRLLLLNDKNLAIESSPFIPLHLH